VVGFETAAVWLLGHGADHHLARRPRRGAAHPPVEHPLQRHELARVAEVPSGPQVPLLRDRQDVADAPALDVGAVQRLAGQLRRQRRRLVLLTGAGAAADRDAELTASAPGIGCCSTGPALVTSPRSRL